MPSGSDEESSRPPSPNCSDSAAESARDTFRAIGSQMRRLHYAKTIMACGKGQDVLMELTGLKSYPAGLTMTAARRASEGFCRRAVELCLQTDVRMKTSYDDPERLLELLVVELAQEARRG